MANDREDFAPEIRNNAWWASDTRQAVNGRANEVVLTKLGLKEPVDLSDVEKVQMGHVLEPVIGRLAQDRLKMNLKEAPYMLTHPKEVWLKSHFDFISDDGKTLVEAKNYSASVRNKFDTEANIIPQADMAQLIHEATVHNVDNIVLAVLFGGQEFCTFSFTITQDQKDNLIRDMAVYWSHVIAKNPLPPETPEQARLLYATDDGTSVSASLHIERIAEGLKKVKQVIKEHEEMEAGLLTALQSHMRHHSQLLSADGKILATWKTSKGSKRFDANLFKKSMPDIYEGFMIEQLGSRRFLIK